MSKNIKDKTAILNKLGIDGLNQMQESSSETIVKDGDIVLLSPTGTGKTLAFLLPLLELLDKELLGIQALILVPSRELAIQIEQVAREMGSGYKVNAVYGGRAGYKDKTELKHPPSLLIGTPGRVADHMRNEVIDTQHIRILILDEFDKSLETGFEKEMKEIIDMLPSLEKRILTSATYKVEIPEFVNLSKPTTLNFLDKPSHHLEIKTVLSKDKDKLKTLVKLLGHIGEANGIIFCNFKDDINVVSDFLWKNKVNHTCFFGGMEQIDRERSLIKFRNGTHRILLATDLAARGIDVPEMDYIIHYQLPFKEDEFIHRNGRTARMHKDGIAYVMRWKEKPMPEYIKEISEFELTQKNPVGKPRWQSLIISGGRKDKISKGDIAGLFFKQGGLEKNELGIIELKQDCAFVAVPRSKAKKLVASLNNSRLKKKKVRITVLP